MHADVITSRDHTIAVCIAMNSGYARITEVGLQAEGAYPTNVCDAQYPSETSGGTGSWGENNSCWIVYSTNVVSEVTLSNMYWYAFQGYAFEEDYFYGDYGRFSPALVGNKYNKWATGIHSTPEDSYVSPVRCGEMESSLPFSGSGGYCIGKWNGEYYDGGCFVLADWNFEYQA